MSQDVFAFWISCWVLVGYLLAVIPPYIIDPLLKSAKLFGPRTYPLAWVTYAIIAPLLFAVTLVAMIGTSGEWHLFAVAVPMVGAVLISLPVFRPQMPHLNVVFVMTMWVIMTVVTVWIHDAGTALTPTSSIHLGGTQVLADAYRDYLKEEIGFWKTVWAGLMATFLVSVLATLKEMVASNERTVSDPEERALMHINSYIQLAFASAYFIMGPMYESAEKALHALRLLAAAGTPS